MMNRPILVHTMGKVGSRAVMDMFGRYINEYPGNIPLVAHCHYLRYPNRVQDLKVKQLLANNPAKPVVITVVRDPIARNVSAYFQNRGEFSGKLFTEDYIKKYRHTIPLDYMFTEIQEMWDLVGYNGASNVRGFRGYETPKADVWVFNLRALYLLPSVMGAAYDIPDIHRIDMKNFGATLSTDYLEFKQRLRKELPKWYIDSMVQSKYANTFFSEEERNEWVRKWTTKERYATLYSMD